MERAIITNKKLVEAVKNIPTAADLQRWVFTIDNEEGTLFYSPKRISDNAELHQVTYEYTHYTDENLNPLVVMVDCYNVTFFKYRNLFKKLSLKIFRGNDIVKVVDPGVKNSNKANVKCLGCSLNGS
jgi:hypothetical protein